MLFILLKYTILLLVLRKIAIVFWWFISLDARADYFKYQN